MKNERMMTKDELDRFERSVLRIEKFMSFRRLGVALAILSGIALGLLT